MLTGLIDDLERILDEIFGDTTGWDIAAGALVLVATWPVALGIGWVVKKLVLLIPGANIGIASFAKWAVRLVVWLIGIAWALTVLDVGYGFVLVIVIVVIVAAVVLVQPIVRNIGAGVALPFWVGDQIETHQYAGTVTSIGLRQTVIETRDRRRVVIPNSDVLANPIVVFTAFDHRRSSVEVGVIYDTDIEAVSELLVQAISSVEGVHDDPPPYARPVDIAEGMYRLTLRWWHDPDLATAERTQGAVLTAVKRTLDNAGIPVPPPASIFLTETPRGEPSQ